MKTSDTQSSPTSLRATLCLVSRRKVPKFSRSAGRAWCASPARHLENGTVLVRDGVIEAVGTNTSPLPADAWVIEGKGTHGLPRLSGCNEHVGIAWFDGRERRPAGVGARGGGGAPAAAASYGAATGQSMVRKTGRATQAI